MLCADGGASLSQASLRPSSHPVRFAAHDQQRTQHDDRRNAIEDHRVEVQQWQWVAPRHFRWAVAGARIFFDLAGLFSIFDSHEDLAANILMVVGSSRSRRSSPAFR